MIFMAPDGKEGAVSVRHMTRTRSLGNSGPSCELTARASTLLLIFRASTLNDMGVAKCSVGDLVGEALFNEREWNEKEVGMDARRRPVWWSAGPPARCSCSYWFSGATWPPDGYRQARGLYSASLPVTESVTPILRATLGVIA